MIMDSGALSPADFAEAAVAAIQACAGFSLREAGSQIGAAGISGMCAGEAVGGLGLPIRFALPVLTAAGSELFAFPLLETVLAARATEQSAPDLAASIVAGGSIITIAWSGSAEGKRIGERIKLNGTVGRAPFADSCSHVIVSLAHGGAIAVPVATPGVVCSPLGEFDYERPSFLVRLDNVELDADRLISEEHWAEMELDARLGRAALAFGCAEASLGLAEEHANTRRQFGRALSANQAMRHLLAREKLLLEGVRNILASVDTNDDSVGALRKTACYLVAMEGGISIVEKSIQVHGAMGFTWEMPLHRHLRWLRELKAQGNADHALLAVADSVIDSNGHQYTF